LPLQGVTDLVYDLLDRGGKRWRPVMGIMFAECYGRNIIESIETQIKNGDPVEKNPNQDILWALALTEIMHNASLMVDDLEDKSLMRRGDKCIHLKYGDDYTCNTGTLMYLAPIVKLRDFIEDDKLQLDIMNICQEEMFNLHFG
jgi:geranylgeranyl pyrophosphate synthase